MLRRWRRWRRFRREYIRLIRQHLAAGKRVSLSQDAKYRQWAAMGADLPDEHEAPAPRVTSWNEITPE